MFLREQGRGGWKPAEGVKVRDKGEHRQDQAVAQGRDKVQQQVEGCRRESAISVFLMEEKEEKQKMREAEMVQCFALFLQGMGWGETKNQYIHSRHLKGSQEMKSEEELRDCLKIKKI